MQHYDAIVHLGGSPAHAVQKIGISAAELMLLRHVHTRSGVDPIARATLNGVHEVDSSAERGKLDAVYGNKVVAELFGADRHAPLPQIVPGLAISPSLTPDEGKTVNMDKIVDKARAESKAEIDALKKKIAELESQVKDEKVAAKERHATIADKLKAVAPKKTELHDDDDLVS